MARFFTVIFQLSSLCSIITPYFILSLFLPPEKEKTFTAFSTSYLSYRSCSNNVSKVFTIPKNSNDSLFKLFWNNQHFPSLHILSCKKYVTTKSTSHNLYHQQKKLTQLFPFRKRKKAKEEKFKNEKEERKNGKEKKNKNKNNDKER